MKFLWCTIMVKNMEESLKFYQDILELKLDRRFSAGPDMELAFLKDGETEVELICNKAISEPVIGKDISLGFKITGTSEEMMNKLKEKGIAIHSGPFQPNPHVKFFYILDPNGLKIQFVENL